MTSLLLTGPAATLIKATALLLVALGGLALQRRASAATRHLWGTLTLGGLLLVPILSLWGPGWQVEVPAPAPTWAEALPTPALATPPARAVVTSPAAPSPALAAPAPTLASPVRPVHHEALATPTPPPAPKPFDWAGFALMLWGLGAAILSLRLVAGAAWMVATVRRATPLEDDRVLGLVQSSRARLDLHRQPRVLVSPSLEVAMLWGHFRPVLLLPQSALGWSSERLRMVLTHELAHLKRGDWLTLLVGRLAVAAYWFHPLAWVLEARSRRDCEAACDDQVLASGIRASDYASNLLALARGLQRPSEPALAVALIRPSQLEQRLRSILRPDQRRRSPGRGAVLVTALACLALLLPLASVQLSAYDPAVGSEGFRADPAVPVGIQLAQLRPLEDHDRAKRYHHEPRDGGEWFERAYDMHHAERYEEAIAAFERAIEAGYRPATSKYNIACGYALMGHADEALDWLEDALASGFDSYDLLFEDSDFDPIRDDGRFRAVLEDYRDRAHHHEDRWESAQRRYQALIDARSEHAEAWHDVGTDFLRLRQLDEAVEALERAVQLEGHNSTMVYNLACAYSRAGQVQLGLDTLARAVQAGFDSEERFENDRDLDHLRDSARFQEIWRDHDILSMDQWKDDRWYRGEDRHRIDPARWAPAITAYQEYVAASPSSGRAWFNLGWALHYSGRHDEAVDAFDRALTNGYKPSLMMYNIACAHARAGHHEVAMDWIDRAAEAGFEVGHHLDDDPDFDDLRSYERFREMERTYEREAHRDHLREMKRELERKLRQLGESVGLISDEGDLSALEAQAAELERRSRWESHEAAKLEAKAESLARQAAELEAQRKALHDQLMERELREQAREQQDALREVEGPTAD